MEENGKSKNESIHLHNRWNAGKAVLRGKFIEIQAFLKKQEKNLKQPNLPPKRIRKRTNKIQSQQKEGNNKIREKINKIEFKNNRTEQ